MAPNTMSTDLSVLVDVVQREAKSIADFCNASASPPLSLSQAWPDDIPENIQDSRMKLREATKAIYDIATGPHDHLFSIAWSVSTLPCILYYELQNNN